MGHRLSIAVQPTPLAKVMSHLSGEVIRLDNRAGALTSGQEGEGGTSRSRAIHPFCFEGCAQGHSSQARLLKALGFLRAVSQALHTGGEGR